MKKILLTAFIMLICVFTLSACDKNAQQSNNSHIHMFGDWVVVKEATCTISGKQNRSCNCGKEETRIIDALGHIEVTDTAIAATCTADGKTEGKHCSRCNEILVAQSVVDKLDHTEVIDTAIAATCTTDGKTEGKHCSRCNEILVAQAVLGKLGHIEVIDTAIAATCTTDGKTEGKHCSRCNEILVAQAVVDKLGHIEVIDTAIAATCTTEGKTEGKHCSRCNEVLIVQEVIGPHMWELKEESLLPTWKKVYICQLCQNKKTETIGKIVSSKSVDSTNIFIDHSVQYKGQYSYCITSKTPIYIGLEQNLQLKPNTTYIISANVKTEDVISHDNQFFSLGANLSAEEIYNNSKGNLGYSDWKKISVIAQSDSQGKLTASMNLGYWYNDCSGTVWFDGLTITEVTDNNEKPSTWKFLFVVLENTSLKTYDSELDQELNLSYHLTDKQYAALCKSIDDFQTDMNKIANGRFLFDVSTVKCSAEFSTYDKISAGYYINSESALDYLLSQNINLENYDHVVFLSCFPELPRTYWGLGGTYLDKYLGYSQIVYGNWCEWYCYDVSPTSWPAGVIVHEFLHFMETYAREFGYEIASPDQAQNYGYENVDDWRNFYTDFINNEIHNNEKMGIPEFLWYYPPTSLK